MFLRKGVLKICRKFAGEHACQSVISIKLQSNLIEITFRHGCSPVILLHIFRTPLLFTATAFVLNYKIQPVKKSNSCLLVIRLTYKF